MKISLNWIKDYVDLKGINVNKLLNQFTLSVAEIEEVEYVGAELSGIITAKIKKVSEHPDSKKLHLLKVDTGKAILDVVCGAPNVREGMITAFAKIGAHVNGMDIEKAKVAGVYSYGMCCSEKELALSDDNSGIMEFQENTKNGVDIKKIIDVEDVIFEVDNKSLTNRPDLWGHYGIAREIAALTKRELKPIAIERATAFAGKEQVKVKVTSDSCFRYTCATVKNITKNVSPINMRLRLYYCGMRGINLLADLTNYIMLELGQPMHAFDNTHVTQIGVSKVKEDTVFKTLDEEERTLSKGTTVITNGKDISAVAGVMGGLDSEIKDDTHSVLIESANFNGIEVRKTATSLNLRTESSARYEKMLDPELTLVALKRYVYLLKSIDAGAMVSSGITDIYNHKYPKMEIQVSKSFIDNYTGIDIPDHLVKEILKSLEFKVKETKKGIYQIAVPTFRATKDINGRADIVEEITRIYGYDNITAKSTYQPLIPVKLNRNVKLEYEVKYALATRYNMHEIHSYIWYDTAFNNQFGIKAKSVIKGVNSINKDNPYIRSTMLPSLLQVVYNNKFEYADFGVMEIGRVVEEMDKETNLAKEIKSLGMVLYSKNGTMEELLLKMKDMLEYTIHYEAQTRFSIKPAKPTTNYFHPVNYYHIFCNNKKIGKMGLLHPSIKNNLEKKSTIVMAELNFTELVNAKEFVSTFEVVSKYQKSTLDFNFVVNADKYYSDIEEIAHKIKSDIKYAVSLVDIFENSDGTKSYTLRYEIYSLNHTLTGEEIENFHKDVIEKFKEENINLKA